MLSVVDLAARPGFAISMVTCREDHARWSETEAPGSYRMVLVRRGRFRRRVAGVPIEVDPTLAYLAAPDDEEQFAHPAGGDVCTSVSLAPALWRMLAGDTARMRRPTVYVDAQLDLVHRRLLATAGTGDVDYALPEQLLGLLGRAVAQVVPGQTPAGTRNSGNDHALVATARAVIAESHPASAGLFSLAELLGVSPYRLSRAFTRELGVSLTRYRNRVRVGRALDHLEDGERGLGVLAADLGFADQAHLCRTVREHVGHTPTELRRLLS